jgi:hypothetical protein
MQRPSVELKGKQRLRSESLSERLEINSIRIPESTCVWWISGIDANGYGELRFNKKLLKAHRAAWIVANGDIPAGLCVLHRCDNRLCINQHHLFLGTNADNTADMVKKGRHPRGATNGRAKLTEKEVHEIRRSALSNRKLASLYGVDRSIPSEIRNRIIWKSLPEEVM